MTWTRRLICSLLALVFLVTVGAAVALGSGNDFVVGDLRVDLPEVYSAGDYRVHLLAYEKPTTGYYRDFTTAWLGAFLAEFNGQPGSGQFSQVGFITQKAGVRWFVYAEPGVDCLLGGPDDPNDTQHCYGDYGELVTLNTWQQVELVKYPQDNFWIARVYDTTGSPHDVAKIWSTSNRIYLARSDTEEGYYEAGDPYITASFYHWHPQYMNWQSGWQDWPASSGGNCNDIWTSPVPICPYHYGANPNMWGDPRSWFAGTGGKWCDVDPLFPTDYVYLPDIKANSSGWNSTIIVRNNSSGDAHVQVAFYDHNGNMVGHPHTELRGRAVWNLDASSVTTNFAGSAIVYASQDVAVVVKSLDSDEVIGYTGFSPTSSLGFARPGPTVYLPQYFNNHSGWYSTAWVQNTGSAATTVTAYYYNLSGGQVGSQSHNIAPGATYGFTPPAGIPSTGSMRLTASQPLAAVLEARKASPAQSGVVNGSSGGRNSLRAPLIMRSYGGWTTGLVVQNIGSSPADIDVAYYDSGGNPVGAGDHATGVPRWASQSFYPPAVGDGFLGSAVVTSAQPLVALVNELDSSGQRLLNHCAFDRGVPTLYLPLVENNNGGWTSGIIVQNTVGSAHTVSVTYYNSNGGLVGTQSLSNIPPYAQRFFVPAVPSGSAYSAVLSSSKRFAVVVNEVKEGVGGMSYNGSD
jgi:hypothetical protein